MWTRSLARNSRLSSLLLPLPGLNLSITEHVTGAARICPAAHRHDDASGGASMIPVTRQREWNRAIAHAEKLVGFPTSVFHLQSLMTDDVTSMTSHLRKLMTSDHPILKTVKRLIHFEGKTDAQVRGLIVLLLSRATATEQVSGSSDYDSKTGVLGNQRNLAEVIEMIHSAQQIHRSVLNLPFKLPEAAESEAKTLQEDLEELEYGNKLAILGGDYLLANACTNLANLNNTYVTELIALSIAEFAQSEFIGKRDVQGRFIPDKPEHLSSASWTQRARLAHATLLQKGCTSAGILAGLPEEDCQVMGRIGEGISLALQAYTEVEPYLDSNVMSFVSTGQVMDLSTAPVLFHLKTDPALLSYIRDCSMNNIENIDCARVYNAVRNGPGLAEAKSFCTKLATDCIADIEKLPDGPAKTSLIKLAGHLRY